MRIRVGLFVLGLSLAAGRDARAEDDLALDLGGTTLETRHVTHGTFTQGSPASEVGHEKDEEPARHVTISKDFWMGKYPVTRGQFAKFVADTRYISDAERGQAGGSGWDGKQLTQKKDATWRSPGFTQTDDHPVVLVSFGDANAFVGWASRKSGKRVRLPTEAEWEYAARGGSTTPWYGATTEAETAAIGWFKPNAGTGTRPVGQKKPNTLGLFDMSGNVFEWCRDVYGPYHEGAVVDPEAVTNTGTEPERRVLRAGSWLRDPKRGRSADRHRNAPGTRNAEDGFRVVVTNEESVAPGATGAGADFAPAAPLGVPTSPAASAVAPSGPLADGEALRIDPVARGSEAFSWGLLLASPLAASSAVVAWMLLRRKRTPGSTARPRPRPTTAAPPLPRPPTPAPVPVPPPSHPAPSRPPPLPARAAVHRESQGLLLLADSAPASSPLLPASSPALPASSPVPPASSPLLPASSPALPAPPPALPAPSPALPAPPPALPAPSPALPASSPALPLSPSPPAAAASAPAAPPSPPPSLPPPTPASSPAVPPPPPSAPASTRSVPPPVPSSPASKSVPPPVPSSPGSSKSVPPPVPSSPASSPAVPPPVPSRPAPAPSAPPPLPSSPGSSPSVAPAVPSSPASAPAAPSTPESSPAPSPAEPSPPAPAPAPASAPAPAPSADSPPPPSDPKPPASD